MSIPSTYFDKLPVPLAQRRQLDWTLPKEAGTLSATDIDGFGVAGWCELFGLPLKGLHKLSLGQGFASLEVNIGIPGIFSGTAPNGDAYGAGRSQCSNGSDDDRDGEVDSADGDCKTPNDNYESAADGPGFIGSRAHGQPQRAEGRQARRDGRGQHRPRQAADRRRVVLVLGR